MTAEPPASPKPRRRRTATRPPPEAHLVRLWAAGALGAEAVTAGGEPVEVLYPGRPGGRSGPDFRDAVVRVGGSEPVVGDVELHRAASDFAAHGHATDPAYGSLALHAVFAADTTTETALPGGRTVPVVPVNPAIAAGLPVREPCATAPTRLGEDAAERVVLDAARWRLARKAEAAGLIIARQGAAQALYALLATALGQKANASPFALLAERIPLAALLAEGTVPGPERVARFTRMLLHAAGLDGALLSPGPVLPWAAGTRPAAHPTRRITALATIVDRLARPSLVDGAEALIEETLATGGPARLLAAMTVRNTQPPAPCGRGRAVEVVVNAVLPWAVIRAGVTPRRDAILDLALTLPATEPYGAIAHLQRNLRRADGRPLLRTPLHTQGALALLSEWCARGGCGRCPLS